MTCLLGTPKYLVGCAAVLLYVCLDDDGERAKMSKT